MMNIYSAGHILLKKNMTVTKKIHLIKNIKPYIGLINLKYTCFKICLDFFFKMNGQLEGSGDRGTNKCLYISL